MQSTRNPDLILLCTCEGTFDPAADRVAAACPSATILDGRQFCRAEIGRALDALKNAKSATIACTQERPAFDDAAREAGVSVAIRFVNIRETAGWSSEGANAGAKIAALVAAADSEAVIRFASLESGGVTLIYGRDDAAIELGRRLESHLDVTVMLTRPGEITPLAVNRFPVVKGNIRRAKGVLGRFEITVDDFASPDPSSRTHLTFGPARDGALSQADILIDITGGEPLLPGADLRPGYLRAAPNDRVAFERLISEARDLIGTFDKPRFIDFHTDLCAHSRSRITGCTRCLSVCPAGAIEPAGDTVAIDPGICGGCGGCATVCPTGAAEYALPKADVVMARARRMLGAYRDAGGEGAVVLVHDEAHGTDLIGALARFGAGLPARVIPFAVQEITALGLETIAALFAYGAAGVIVLHRVKPKHDLGAIERTTDTARRLLDAFGLGADRLRLVPADDPDGLAGHFIDLPAPVASPAARFLPQGSKRQLMLLALREWQAHAPERPERVALAAGAPFGRVVVDAAGCTLCHACVSACPTAALQSNADRPELKFQEDLCVQCGLCQATCPERVITLEPRLDFAALAAPPVTLKVEEPYPCERCGKLFGTKSTIERIKAKLSGSHWMFSGSNAGRAQLIGLCDDCRVVAVTETGFDPYDAPERPRVRTSADYFAERSEDKEEG